jgi:hypothetical protein
MSTAFPASALKVDGKLFEWETKNGVELRYERKPNMHESSTTKKTHSPRTKTPQIIVG